MGSEMLRMLSKLNLVDDEVVQEKEKKYARDSSGNPVKLRVTKPVTPTSVKSEKTRMPVAPMVPEILRMLSKLNLLKDKVLREDDTKYAWDYYSHQVKLMGAEPATLKALRLYRVWLTGIIALHRRASAALDNRKTANFWILLHLYRTMENSCPAAQEKHNEMVVTCLVADEMNNSGHSPCFLKMLSNIVDKFPQCQGDMFGVGEKLLPAFYETSPVFTTEIDDKDFIESIKMFVPLDHLTSEMERLAVGARLYRSTPRPTKIDMSGVDYLLVAPPAAPKCLLRKLKETTQAFGDNSLSYMLRHFIIDEPQEGQHIP